MPRPRTDIKPRIVQAARVRFLAEGVDGASLRTIAADAGTSVGMIFYYFPIKDDLFLAVVEEFYEKLLADLSAALGGDDAVQARLQRAFARLGTSTDEELAVIRLVAREALLSSERFHKVLARAQRGHLAMLMAALAEGVRRGEIDRELPLAMVLVCCLALGGMPQMVRRATRGNALFAALPSAQKLAEASSAMLFRAIGPGAGTPVKPQAARKKRRRHRTVSPRAAKG